MTVMSHTVAAREYAIQAKCAYMALNKRMITVYMHLNANQDVVLKNTVHQLICACLIYRKKKYHVQRI